MTTVAWARGVGLLPMTLGQNVRGESRSPGRMVWDQDGQVHSHHGPITRKESVVENPPTRATPSFPAALSAGGSLPGHWRLVTYLPPHHYYQGLVVDGEYRSVAVISRRAAGLNPEEHTACC